MSDIGLDKVKYLSALARLGLRADEMSAFAPELKQIMEFVDQLEQVPTDKVEATNQVTGLVDVWREDEVSPSKLSRDQLLENAPASEDGYIKVKRVLQ